MCSGARSGEGDQRKSDTTAAVTGGKEARQQLVGRKPAGGKEARQQQVGRKPGNSRWEGSQATAGGKEALSLIHI